jgi:hypothetical protein
MPRQHFESAKTAQAIEVNHALRVQLIIVELELATTFAKSAESAVSNERATRNLDHARRAYNAACHFLQTATPEPETAEYISANVVRLRARLEELGQRLDQ